jgi:hypothetical protein
MKYYGIRYLGGNRTCTTGSPNPITGRYSRAVDVQVFRSRTDRDNWVNAEKLSAPCGLGGGERIAATKQDCRKCCLGMSVEEFNLMLETAEDERYDTTDYSEYI